MAVRDLQGQKFGRLTVLGRGTPKSDRWGHAMWYCECECGDHTTVRGRSLLKDTRSCGCLYLDVMFAKYRRGEVKLMQCELISLLQYKDVFTAQIVRLEDHPRLGPPKKGAYSVTSAIRSIDFDKGLMITQNNIYSFKGKIDED